MKEFLLSKFKRFQNDDNTSFDSNLFSSLISTGKHGLLFLIFFMSSQAFAQIGVTMTATNETCTNNGVLNWSTTGATSGSTIVYSIYKAPDYATAIATTSPPTSSLTGLSAGSYRIIVTETIGASSTTAQANATITDVRIPLNFSATTVNPICLNDGTITVNVTSANSPVKYSLTGPVSYPEQDSNVFTGLSGGNYNVIVKDACGETKVITYSIIKYTPNLQITNENGIGDGTICGFAQRRYTLGAVTTGSAIFWPLQLQITAYPPGGGPSVVTNTTITNGTDIFTTAPNSVQKYLDIPYFPTAYNYDMVFTDACGTVYTFNRTLNTPPNTNFGFRYFNLRSKIYYNGCKCNGASYNIYNC